MGGLVEALRAAARLLVPRRCARCGHLVWGPTYRLGERVTCSIWCLDALMGRR